MIRWIKSLFENKKARKVRNVLKRDDVEEIETDIFINKFSRNRIVRKYNISNGTYYKIRNSNHRYSWETSDASR